MSKIDVNLVRALSDSAEKKLVNTFNVKERNEVILKSGKPLASSIINLETGERYYLPKIGKFVFCSEKNERKEAHEAFWLALEIAEILKGGKNGK